MVLKLGSSKGGEITLRRIGLSIAVNHSDFTKKLPKNGRGKSLQELPQFPFPSKFSSPSHYFAP